MPHNRLCAFCYCYEDNTSRFLSIMKMFRVNKIQKIILTIKFMFCLSNILCKFYFKKITKICQISTWRTKLIKILQSNFLINFFSLQSITWKSCENLYNNMQKNWHEPYLSVRSTFEFAHLKFINIKNGFFFGCERTHVRYWVCVSGWWRCRKKKKITCWIFLTIILNDNLD